MRPSVMALFTPECCPINNTAMDFGNCGLIAYVSGCAINLAHIADHQLHRACPIVIDSGTITCIKFHPYKRIIAAGDANGQITLWDIDVRGPVATAKHPNGKGACLCLEWWNGRLIVLFESANAAKLVAFSVALPDKVCKCVWEIPIRTKSRKFSIDPSSGAFLLLTGKDNVFGIYRMGSDKPVPVLERVELQSGYCIEDAQWSVHLPGYAFIIQRDDVSLFHVEGRSMIPVILSHRATAAFDFLLQLPSDYSKFLVFSKNGEIAAFGANDGVTFKMTRAFQPKCSKGGIVSARASPLNPDDIVVYHSALGLCLLDVKTTRMSSADLSFPTKIASFDCDGTNYCIGTEDGYIISGNVYDDKSVKRFQVGNEKLQFVSFDAALSRIHWQTERGLGYIDLVLCFVRRFNSRTSSSRRFFGSRYGALIVQRDAATLGVFVDGKELPLLMECEIVDIAIDDSASRASSGEFCVLLKNRDICFYSYSKKDGIQVSCDTIVPKNPLPEPLCFATSDTRMATGFSGGLIIVYDRENGETKRYETGFGNLRKLTLSSTTLHGLARESTLFEISADVKICPFPVLDYKVIDEELILLKCGDQSVRFVSRANWHFIDRTTSYTPIPSHDDLLASFIRKRSTPFFEYTVRDVWSSLLDKNNIRLQAMTGIGQKGLFERVHCGLVGRIVYTTPEVIRLRFAALLFADKFAEAACVIRVDDASASNFVESALFSMLLLQIGHGVSDDVMSMIKSTGTSLFEAGQYEMGSLMFHIGGLDKAAVEHLLVYNQEDMAMRFVRSALSENDRRAFAFRFGSRMVDQHRFIESLPFFAAAGEFHPVISILFTHGMMCDAHFLIDYLDKHELLKEVSDENEQQLTERLMPLQELRETIQVEFTKLLSRLGIDEADVKFI